MVLLRKMLTVVVAVLLAFSLSIGVVGAAEAERITVSGYLTTAEATVLCEAEFPGSTLVGKRSTVQGGLQTHVFCAF